MAITTESGGRYRVGKDATQRSSLGDTLRILKLGSQIPASVTGAVAVGDGDDGTVDGKITLTQDMEVGPSGDLTLDIPKLGDVVGGHIIDVEAGGKIKVAGGRENTVLPGTKYRLHT